MGVVLILNNEKFDIKDVSERKNSKKDVISLKYLFYKFNYRVEIVQNPTLKDIRDNLNDLLIEHLKKATCLIVVLMTHGLENDRAYAKDQIYNIGEEILKSNAFQDFKDLPKILIVQACKSFDVKPKSESKISKVYNTLRYNSCFEGGKAVRADDGTLFIQKLCNNLLKYGLSEDFERIADRVNKEFEEEFKLSGIRQCPTIVRYNVVGFEKFYLGDNVKNAFSLKENTNTKFIVG
ncbi:caspase-1-like [Eupeodes corollae]|uniref:caspase-1-like n=1 Tax=Eupeodes corollae TaxID=290404 RepID=UPI00249016DA|nr:caspase-1-like [Eupeodes corollae]